MNESDVDVLCPKAQGPWNDNKCEDGIFDPALPVSPDNERAMITALNDTILSLLTEMRGSDEEDAALLALSDASIGPARRSAIILRQREKVSLVKFQCSVVGYTVAENESCVLENVVRFANFKPRAACPDSVASCHERA